MSTYQSSSSRSRTIEWEDPAVAAAMTTDLSGLKVMQGIRDGTIPPPPMARLIGFNCVVAEIGEVAMEISPEGSVENGLGIAHGGMVATMLDTAMGAAANTVVPHGKVTVTLSLTITYLRVITQQSGLVRVTGKVESSGRRSIYVSGEVKDGTGRLVAHAVGNFTVVDIPSV